MPGTSFVYRRDITEGCILNYAVAGQWLSTYRITHNPRHLDTARICYVIADELYSQSVDEAFDGDKALMQQIRFESRKQVIEAFAALGHAPDVAAAPAEGSRAANR